MNACDLGPCLFCGAPAKELHHPTCRLDPGSPYLDASFVVALCIPCHRAEHVAWRAAGLDGIADPLLARLVRTAWLVGRLGDRNQPVAFPPVILRGLHDSLLVCVDLATVRVPSRAVR